MKHTAWESGPYNLLEDLRKVLIDNDVPSGSTLHSEHYAMAPSKTSASVMNLTNNVLDSEERHLNAPSVPELQRRMLAAMVELGREPTPARICQKANVPVRTAAERSRALEAMNGLITDQKLCRGPRGGICLPERHPKYTRGFA